jgi:subtilisin family serine protease
MAKKYGNKKSTSSSVGLTALASELAAPGVPTPPESSLALAPDAGLTGRMLVVFEQGAAGSGLSSLSSLMGLSDVARSSDFYEAAFDLAQIEPANVLVLDHLDVAILKPDPEQMAALASLSAVASGSALASSGDRAIRRVIPERYVYLTGQAPRRTPAWSRDYLDGRIDALLELRDRFFPELGDQEVHDIAQEAAASVLSPSATQFDDSPTATWGVTATGVPDSPWTGRGIRVAILDSGFELNHPDFRNRQIVAQSFAMAGSNGQDFNGHGTHCTGTACGGRGLNGKRYGIASEADIFIGQVFGLDAQGKTVGKDGDIWAGINWAVDRGCHVVSMSFERDPQNNPVRPGEAFSADYENVAARALQAGTLLIAAGGNMSDRQFGRILPVNQPANCPSVIAVGSIGKTGAISNFSPRAINFQGAGLEGGRVDFIAPGEAVISSWLMPRPGQDPNSGRYAIEQGTSMATPHVAGIAALISQANNGLRGVGLWNKLAQSTRGLNLDAGDAGFGLPIAPR